MINAKYVDGLELIIKELSKKLSDESNNALHLIAENNSLKEQNAALAAQVEALREALEYADNKLYILTHNRNDVSARLIGDADKAFKVVRDALSQPAATHHLAEVKAQAGRAGFVAGYLLCNDGSPLIKHNYEGFADKYADQADRKSVV